VQHRRLLARALASQCLRTFALFSAGPLGTRRVMTISPTLFGCNTTPIPPCIDAAHGQKTQQQGSACRGAITPHAQTSDFRGPRVLGQAEIAPSALRYPHVTATAPSSLWIQSHESAGPARHTDGVGLLLAADSGHGHAPGAARWASPLRGVLGVVCAPGAGDVMDWRAIMKYSTS